MTIPIVLAIDPGVSGAAVLCRGTEPADYLLLSAPDAIVRLAKNYIAIGSRLMKMMLDAQLVAIEAQRPLGKTTTAFATTQLSFFCGTCYQAAAHHNIPIVFVQPNAWKRKLGLAGRPKEASLSLLPPGFQSLPASKAARIAIADAIGIAMYTLHVHRFTSPPCGRQHGPIEWGVVKRRHTCTNSSSSST